jgi:hypothetical protein
MQNLGGIALAILEYSTCISSNHEAVVKEEHLSPRHLRSALLVPPYFVPLCHQCLHFLAVRGQPSANYQGRLDKREK